MSRGRHRVLGWLLAAAAIAAFCTLGAWQLDRRQHKQARLDAVHAVLDARQPVPLSRAAAPARVRDYDWAAGAGRFAEAAPVLLDNQQRGGRAGVLAYRLFAPVDGAPLLVELGWLPLDGARTLPRVARPPGMLQVQGLLAAPPAPGLARVLVAPQPDGSLLATALDPARLAPALGVDTLPPRVLKLDPDLALGYARDLDILPNTLPPERHLGYAVQWFALALAVLVIALVLTLRKPRPRR